MPYCSRDFCSITESRYARYRSIEEDGGRAAQPAARTAATGEPADGTGRPADRTFELVIDKYKRMIFGTKSEKLKGELEQLEFQLEELETEGQQGKYKNHILLELRISPAACAAQAIARGSSARSHHPSSCEHLLSGLRWCPASVWPRCIRAAGAHSGELQGH